MSPAIVDTDVVSFLFKRDSRAEAYEQHLTGRLLGISFMTLAELERWSLERNWGIVRMQQFAVFLRKFAVLPANRELCRKWAEIAAARSRCGHPWGADIGRSVRRASGKVTSVKACCSLKYMNDEALPVVGRASQKRVWFSASPAAPCHAFLPGP